MTTATATRVSLGEVHDLLNLVEREVQELDGLEAPQGTARGDSSTRADLTRRLLFLSHLCDKMRVGVLDEYYVVKGFDKHLLEGS